MLRTYQYLAVLKKLSGECNFIWALGSSPLTLPLPVPPHTVSLRLSSPCFISSKSAQKHVGTQGNETSKRTENNVPPSSVWHGQGVQLYLWNVRVTLSCTGKRTRFGARETRVEILSLSLTKSCLDQVTSLLDYPMEISDNNAYLASGCRV